MARGGASRVQSLRFGRAGGQRGGVLGHTGQLHADWVVGLLADHPGPNEHGGQGVREQLVDRLRDERVGRAQVDPLDRAVEPARLLLGSVDRRVAVDVGSLLEDLLGLGYYGGVAKILH